MDSPHREVRNLATALFEHNDRLFTFLEHEGIEPMTAAETCDLRRLNILATSPQRLIATVGVNQPLPCYTDSPN